MSKPIVGRAVYDSLVDAGLTEDDAELIELVEDPPAFKPQPVAMYLPSKHRAGRTAPLTKEQRRKRERAARREEQARKSAAEDAKAVARG